jgi:hypothetical protein
MVKIFEQELLLICLVCFSVQSAGFVLFALGGPPNPFDQIAQNVFRKADAVVENFHHGFRPSVLHPAKLGNEFLERRDFAIFAAACLAALNPATAEAEGLAARLRSKFSCPRPDKPEMLAN